MISAGALGAFLPRVVLHGAHAHCMRTAPCLAHPAMGTERAANSYAPPKMVFVSGV
jgi:hypothetical protein